MIKISKIKNRYKKPSTVINILASLVVLSVLLLSIGYSAFQNTGVVHDASATVQAQKDIRITGVVATNPVNGATSGYEEYENRSISSSLTLPSANSTMTYQVQITNFGNVEMVLSALSGLPSNLKYTLDPNNYKLGDMLCDDNDDDHCTLAAQKTVNITIGYDTNGYDSSNTTYVIDLEFTFSEFNKVARIGSKPYSSLQAALDKVPTDGTATTVVLLKNTSESVEIDSGQNVILDLQTYTLSNLGNTNVIQNNGTLSISNGTIASDAPTNGAINNNQTGTITISGGRIVMTGGRQALYNDKGRATISGNAYLSSSATERATVHNLSGGTMTITGGTIISTGSMAVNNLGTLTVGTQGGEMSITNPLFQSSAIGAIAFNTTTNISFYDGVVKSRGEPFNDVGKLTRMEDGYGIVTGLETIDGVGYNIAHLGISIKVTFNGNGGTPSEGSRYIEDNNAIGPLPTATRSGYDFDGWYTAANGGTKIDRNYVITTNGIKTFYAHWTESTDVAQIGSTKYATLAAAISAVPTNTQTTITLLKNTAEVLTVPSNKNIIIDFNGKTISNSGKKPVFETAGTLTLTNGSIHTNATQGAINNTAGSLTIDDLEIIATGDRQTLYITGGTVTVTGDSYLSSSTYGKPNGSNMERGTIQVVAGTLIVESGTVLATNQQAISNEGTVIIGTQGEGVSTTSPELRGLIYGIKSTGTVNFYDGVIEGGNAAINGTITNWETGYTPTDGTYTTGGKTYYTKYLAQ